jgi:predicted glycosyltransferase
MNRHPLTEKDPCHLFKVTKIVIGVATGSLVEAVTLGIAAIVISDNKPYSHTYLPTLGKGVIWDYASDKEGVEQLINNFNYTSAHKKAEIQNITRQYRDLFFFKPTEDKVIEAFELF